jgi:hypothetical protein
MAFLRHVRSEPIQSPRLAQFITKLLILLLRGGGFRHG